MSDLSKILFLDIETVPMVEYFEQLSDSMQTLWLTKYSSIKRLAKQELDEVADDDGYFRNAGIFSEFSKIVCISVGFFYRKQGQWSIRIKSFCGDDEKAILTDFDDMIQQLFQRDNYFLCGHNIKEFDIPFICRRFLINGLLLPSAINVAGKKPWEVPFVDTLELWRFGDYKGYTSLKLIAEVLGVPTPKDDIDGSEVASVYYKERNISRIVTYCQKDVLATARIYQRMNNMAMVSDEFVEFLPLSKQS